MGECVCETSWLDDCHIEEYLVSSHCYIPFKYCCKLLENRLDMITLYMDCDSLLLVRSYRVTWKMVYSSLNFKSDTKNTVCTVFSRYISTDVDSDAKTQKQTRPRFTRPALIADISPWDTCVGTAVVV